MKVKEQLRIIQALSGKTQNRLAQDLGVSFATLNSWINGKSQPRRFNKERIKKLYFKHTGQKYIAIDSLTAKKEIIASKSKKNILKKITNNPDIYDQFMLCLTYHSNRIEGSTLTKEETRVIMFDNVALPNKDIVEQLEVKNHQAALSCLLNYLLKSKSITEDLILKLHGILMNGIKTDAGSYRKHSVRILGTNVPTANYLKVPKLMKQIIRDMNQKRKDVVSQVSRIHGRFEQIHPFSDGNGRIGRLIMNAMFLNNNIAPAVIEQGKKRFYNSYLRRFQLKGDLAPLEEFICDAALEGIKILERN